jgi:FKBP-type peptidyl-prolyl cis-trans isomerase
MLKIGIIAISTLIVAFILLNLFSIFKTDLNQPKVEEQPEATEETNQTTVESEAEDVEELLIEVLEAGEGTAAKNGDTLFVHYKGSLLDGTVFDQSAEEPFSFKIGEASVIQGWEEGLLGMQIGEKRLLTIPSEMAYGPFGNPPVIPGGAALQFEVELMDIQN